MAKGMVINMSDVSIITNDEIMEMTQLVFDRYYTELKRQLRRGEIPPEAAEQYCTEILAKVYQAIQLQGVAATSYEMDACAIPIINEEIRKILVPLHLNGYRNLRENPVAEVQQSRQEEPSKVKQEERDAFSALQEVEVTEIKDEEKVPVVSKIANGEIQVCTETSEGNLNPELRMEIRRILQQEFQLEPAQVKPVVVVVNVAAPQTAVQAEETTETVQAQTAQTEAQAAEAQPEEMPEIVQEKTVQEEQLEKVRLTEETEQPEDDLELTGEELAAILGDEDKVEPLLSEAIPGLDWDTVDVIEFRQGREVHHTVAGAEVAATVNAIEMPENKSAEAEEELPKLDFDLEKLAQEEPKEKKNKNSWLWFPIIILLLVLIWLTAGMLMSYDIVPDFNLGYEWFNETLFELF